LIQRKDGRRTKPHTRASCVDQQLLARADTERGRAKVLEVCVACHGEQGVSVAPEFPHLNGQSGAAIYKQLHDYRTGSRTHAQMTDLAKALDEPVIADVAAYYAGQPKRNPNPATLGELPEAIVRLVELGDPNRNIPPCAACHRPGAGGPVEAPILHEQGHNYLVLQLQAYAPASVGTTCTPACERSRQDSHRPRSTGSPPTMPPASDRARPLRAASAQRAGHEESRRKRRAGSRGAEAGELSGPTAYR
jgi:cytochrome c553